MLRFVLIPLFHVHRVQFMGQQIMFKLYVKDPNFIRLLPLTLLDIKHNQLSFPHFKLLLKKLRILTAWILSNQNTVWELQGTSCLLAGSQNLWQKRNRSGNQVWQSVAELQIRGGNEDNLKTFFLISQWKLMLWALIRIILMRWF